MKIYDGRDSFYQWDLNQKITSPTFKVGDEIHFTNARQSVAMVLLAYELDGKVVVDVPNILLQVSLPFLVYRYVADGESSCTVEEYTFNVEQRAKPADYVYTETDVWKVEQLVEQTVEKALLEAKESGTFDGADGKDGKDGTSVTHNWNGTVLTVTSASGTSSADLKGEPGSIDDDVVSTTESWSSKNTVDKLCPSIVETGKAVTISDNIEGYPLHIEAFESSVFHFGKNLFGHKDFEDNTDTYRNVTCTDGVYTVEAKTNVYVQLIMPTEVLANSYEINKTLPPGRYVFSVEQTSNNDLLYQNCHMVISQTTDTAVVAYAGEPFTLRTEGVITGFWCDRIRLTKGTKITLKIQVEAAEKPTEWEACNPKEYEPILYYYPNEWGEENEWYGVKADVIPHKGTNMFTAEENGCVTVTGKADPTKVIEKLTNAIVALGGNV